MWCVKHCYFEIFQNIKFPIWSFELSLASFFTYNFYLKKENFTKLSWHGVVSIVLAFQEKETINELR